MNPCIILSTPLTKKYPKCVDIKKKMFFFLPLVLVHCFINVVALSNQLSPTMSQGRVAIVTGASRGA